MATDTVSSLSAAGFFSEPPGWMLVVLWGSLGYVIFRALAVGLLHTGVVQAWILARLHGIPFGALRLLALAAHGRDVKSAVRSCILAREAGVDLTPDQVAAHARAGGDPERVATALLAARHAEARADWADLAAVDLRGEDPLACVRRSSRPEPAP